MATPQSNNVLIAITQAVNEQGVGQLGSSQDPVEAHLEGGTGGNQIPHDEFLVDIQVYEYLCYQHRDNIAILAILSANRGSVILSGKIARYFRHLKISRYYR
jgi:hypothetical protein